MHRASLNRRKTIAAVAALLAVACLQPSVGSAGEPGVLNVGPHGAYPTIQSAVDVLLPGIATEIRIESGVYHEHVVVPSSLIGAWVDISGGWDSQFAAQDPGLLATQINGDGSGRPLSVYSAGTEVVISHLRITGGAARQDAGAPEGGGIHIEPGGTSRVAVTSCFIDGNAAIGSTYGEGGGIAASIAFDSRLELTECVVMSNYAVSTATGFAAGGGVAIMADHSSTVLVSDTVFAYNGVVSVSEARGGALNMMLWALTEAEVLDNAFVFNSADGALGSINAGAEIWTLDVGALVSRRNLFSGNSPVRGEGYQAFFWASEGAEVAVSDTLVAGGTSKGIYLTSRDSAVLRASNLTAADNADYGIYLYVSHPLTLSLYNSIAFGNGTNLRTSGTTPDMGHNLVGIDPGFADRGAGDYRLTAASSAVDGGANWPPGGLGPMDLDCNPRRVGTVDIGAYEYAGIFADGFETGGTDRWGAAVP